MGLLGSLKTPRGANLDTVSSVQLFPEMPGTNTHERLGETGGRGAGVSAKQLHAPSQIRSHKRDSNQDQGGELQRDTRLSSTHTSPADKSGLREARGVVRRVAVTIGRGNSGAAGNATH